MGKACFKALEGHYFDESTVVVVITGILVGLAVPLYDGIQLRAKKAVGEDNALLLNDAVKQLTSLERMARQSSLGGDPFNGVDIDHHNILMEYIGYTDREKEIKYVEWKTDASIALDNSLGCYVLQQAFDENGLSIPE